MSIRQQKGRRSKVVEGLRSPFHHSSRATIEGEHSWVSPSLRDPASLKCCSGNQTPISVLERTCKPEKNDLRAFCSILYSSL